MKAFEQVERFDKQDDGGRWVYMTHSGGYVMAKRPRTREKPHVFTLKEWAKMPRFEKPSPALSARIAPLEPATSSALPLGHGERGVAALVPRHDLLTDSPSCAGHTPASEKER